MNYEFDIFLSYPRAGLVGPWVHNHFKPVLRKLLRCLFGARAAHFCE